MIYPEPPGRAAGGLVAARARRIGKLVPQYVFICQQKPIQRFMVFRYVRLSPELQRKPCRERSHEDAERNNVLKASKYRANTASRGNNRGGSAIGSSDGFSSAVFSAACRQIGDGLQHVAVRKADKCLQFEQCGPRDSPKERVASVLCKSRQGLLASWAAINYNFIQAYKTPSSGRGQRP